MQLKAVTVDRFRNFVAAQRVEVESQVTCLVGKNEAGKTTLLKALHRLNPANDGENFHLVTEYPRWRLSRDRRNQPGIEAEVRPVSAEFALTPDEVVQVGEVLGSEVPEDVTLTAWRAYDGSTGIELLAPVVSTIRLAASNASVADDDLESLLACESLEDAKVEAKARAKTLKDTGEAARAQRLSKFAGEADKVTVIGVPVGSPEKEQLWGLLPKFFYFSTYSILPGEIDLTDLARKSPDALSPADRSVIALLAHAGEQPSDFMDADYDSRKAELQAASADLSRSVFKYWTQNPDLTVAFDTDNIASTNPSGQPENHRILKIELRDDRHGGVETNFGTRSTGFQWFFSFYAAFSEYQSSNEAIIVLLDEPGTSLHGDAQADFVRFVFEELGASKQTIYTTHSQHMIDPKRYETIRAVHDRATKDDPDQGVVVTRLDLTADPGTILPVESALGYSVSQHLFLGSGHHLVVEGSSDFVYLQRVTDHLLTAGDQGIDPRFSIIPVGGIDNVPAFIAILGRRLQVSALVDGARTSAKRERIRAAALANDVPEGNIVSCSDVEGAPTNADVEDLFDPTDYLRLYNWTFGTSLTVDDLPNTTQPIIKRLHDVRGEFDHALPAHTLTARREEFFSEVSSATIARFKRLFALLNQTLKD